MAGHRYNPRTSQMLPYAPEYPGLTPARSIEGADFWAELEQFDLPPDVITITPEGVFFFYAKPYSGGLGGFWDTVWGGVKGAGSWVKRQWDEYGDDVVSWLNSRGGAKAVREGACVYEPSCDAHYILDTANQQTGEVQFRLAGAGECLGKRIYQASEVPQWITPTGCKPGAKATRPVVTSAGITGQSLNDMIQNYWPWLVGGAVLWFLVGGKRESTRGLRLRD